MSNSSLHPSSSNLYIPPELLREIFSYCDTPTLGSVCKVSQACLELASPFLYAHVVVHSVKAVVKLFLFDVSLISNIFSPLIEDSRTEIDHDALLLPRQTSSPPSSPLTYLPRLHFPLSRIKTFTYVAPKRLYSSYGTELDTRACLDVFDPRIPLPSLRAELPTPLLPSLLPPPLEIDVVVLSLAPKSQRSEGSNSVNYGGHGSNVLQLFNPSTFVLRGRTSSTEERDGVPYLNSYHSRTFDEDLPSWNRLSNLVFSSATCDLAYSHREMPKARSRRQGGPQTFAIYLDYLDAPSRALEKVSSYQDWYSLARWAQADLDLGAASSMEVVVWVETEEEREELVKLTKKGAEDAILGGGVSAAFEIGVEVHPSRVGKRNREDGWAGKSIESWR